MTHDKGVECHRIDAIETPGNRSHIDPKREGREMPFMSVAYELISFILHIASIVEFIRYHHDPPRY